jgi:hypothetical protein
VIVHLPLSILRQPDYTTCGPTSLHAVYAFYDDAIPLQQVIDEIETLEGGGTLSVHLAVHALRRGYQADLWVCNVAHWDPTWFKQKTDLAAKLQARLAAKGRTADARYAKATEATVEYLRLGGRVYWSDLTPGRIYDVLRRGYPILTGTNGTYLYQSARETPEGEDDVKGDAFGHFLVVAGCDTEKDTVDVADPLKDNPLHGTNYYTVTVHRLIGAIFLGAASDDANCLIIRPKTATGAAQ